jgi:hypothetical protein
MEENTIERTMLTTPMSPNKNNGVKANVIGCFRKRTFIEVFCKKCGIRYSDDGEYEKVFQDKADAIETITQDDNWLVKGRDAFCENCQ